MTPTDTLQLRLVSKNDTTAVKNFVREFYFENEPIHKHLYRKECKDFRYLDRIGSVGQCINEGLSYMYVTETGEIVAFGMVGYTVSRPSPEEYAIPILQKLKPFFDMIQEEVKSIANLSKTDKEASFRIVAVHPDWIGSGLAKLLVEKVMASLKSLGFTHIKSLCTGAYSTKLFQKCGFKKLYSWKYADYTQNGEIVFLPDEPHTHLNFMHIKL